MAKPDRVFKDPLYMTAWLEVALEKEQQKYEKCPIVPDMAPGHNEAQAWGYVVTGYFLAEQSFKALLYLRGKEAPRTHPLSTLYDSLDDDDKEILREFYADYRATISGIRGEFRFGSLDEFLVNLDGDTGSSQGSLAWRYYLIEEVPEMPYVSVDYLHEVVFGCTKIVEYARNGRFDPARYTHSWRLRWERKRTYDAWLRDRMGSSGWDDLGDRLEILWGPDYRGRHDLWLFEGTGLTSCFSAIPEYNGVPVVDKREETGTLLSRA